MADPAAARASAPPKRWRSAPPATRRCWRSWRSNGTASRSTRGPVVVTGAAGGVGSMAVALLSRLGYQVVAVTGQVDAARLPDGARCRRDHRPRRTAGHAEAARQGTLGRRHRRGRRHDPRQRPVDDHGRRRGRRLRQRRGLRAATSVAPFILRGVSLLGIEFGPRAATARRIEAWDRLARDLDRDKLAAMTTTMPWSGIVNAAQRHRRRQGARPAGGGDRLRDRLRFPQTIVTLPVAMS